MLLYGCEFTFVLVIGACCFRFVCFDVCFVGSMGFGLVGYVWCFVCCGGVGCCVTV